MNNMVRFIDINTGNVFDGSYPYIFWFDGDQSTNIIYSKNIHFICEYEQVDIKLPSNNVFKLIDISKIDMDSIEMLTNHNYLNINDIIVDGDKITSYGYPYKNVYIHSIYIIGSTSQPGTYREEFVINNESFTIGADFYGENESLYINLSNNGVEIPETIQKSFYEANIYEDKRDNILLNRKWKELLSNAIDIFVNKGSYKSLYNSLKWFGYGDMVKLFEFWKDENFNTSRYFTQEISPVIKNKYLEYLYNYSKTTYLGLCCALERYKTVDGHIMYDDERNPILERYVDKSTARELSLKLCLLGNFYETYFMPIHLDLIQSTIENIVYTNTFKVVSGAFNSRYDYIKNIYEIKCNVNDGDCFNMDNVKCFVGPNTLFGTKGSSSYIMGVQRDTINESMNNEEISSFVSQMYNNTGAIIDFNIELPMSDGDFIKKESLTIISPKYTQTNVEYKLIKSNRLSFSILCEYEGEYDIRMQFITLSNNCFTKQLKINVCDTKNAKIEVYKILNNGKYIQDRIDLSESSNTFAFKFNNGSPFEKYKQYIPVHLPEDNADNWRGVKLSHLLILEYLGDPNYALEDALKLACMNNYFIFNRKVKVEGKEKQYIIGFSKKFEHKLDSSDIISISNSKFRIYRSEYKYIPCFHILQKIDGYDINNYIITNDDALCVIPNISFGRFIDKYTWEFVNVSNPDINPINIDTKEPFISHKDYMYLQPGYYDIIFKYNLIGDDKINTIRMDSAFIKQ